MAICASKLAKKNIPQAQENKPTVWDGKVFFFFIFYFTRHLKVSEIICSSKAVYNYNKNGNVFSVMFAYIGHLGRSEEYKHFQIARIPVKLTYLPK